MKQSQQKINIKTLHSSRLIEALGKELDDFGLWFLGSLPLADDPCGIDSCWWWLVFIDTAQHQR